MVNKMLDRSPERARQDYCKAIYQLGEGEPVRSAEVARRLGVSRASVSKLVRDLQRRGFVRVFGASRDLRLTARGRRLALDVIRRHRLIETFLHRSLGVPLDQVHAEAERIEHAVSGEVARRLERFLGYPQFDPHGDLIGGSDERRPHDLPLSQARPGQSLRITRISDRNPNVVRTLIRGGLLPGSVLTIVATRPRSTTVRRDHKTLRLPWDVVAALRVARVERSRRVPA